LAFGKWVMLSGLLGWFYGWMDAIVVGHYLGPRDMGLYRTGNTLVTMIFGLIFSSLLPVLYSMFSSAQYSLVRLREALGTVAHAIALVALPIGFCLYSAGGIISDVFLGSPWQGVNQVIAFMALTHAFSWIVGANGEVYRAIGRPSVETWASSIMLLIYLSVYLFAVQFGLKWFLMSRFGLALIAMIVHIGVARCVLGVPIFNWCYSGILISSGASAILVNQIQFKTGLAFMDLVYMICTFSALFLVGIALFEHSFVLKLIRMARSKT
jgi:PST family polysaccharide transporter